MAYTTHPATRKANQIFERILQSIDLDDRRRLLSAMDDLRSHVENGGTLPDLTGADLIDEMIDYAGADNIIKRLHALMEFE